MCCSMLRFIQTHSSSNVIINDAHSKCWVHTSLYDLLQFTIGFTNSETASKLDTIMICLMAHDDDLKLQMGQLLVYFAKLRV